jgi:hypothetical protein
VVVNLANDIPKFRQMKKIIKPALLFSLVILAILGFQYNAKHGPLIATHSNGVFTVEISKEKIENSLRSLLSPANSDFRIESYGIVDYQKRKFLKIIGTNNEICMVALEEIKGTLYELNDNSIPIVVCFGCDDGCNPKLSPEGWACTDGCTDCRKSASISNEYVFD